MPRTKQRKKDEVKTFPNVFFNGKKETEAIKNNWQKKYFKNTNPIVLELGCGYGEYTTGLAQQTPNKNYIGIDLKGDRIWQGAKFAIENKLNNIGFIVTEINRISDFLKKNEVDEIWITFPDPQPKKEKRRLTHPLFLEIYKNILKPNGIIHLKTDSDELFDWTLKALEVQKNFGITSKTEDFHNSQFAKDSFGITTRYEKKYLDQGVKIKYICFRSASK